MTLVAAYRVAGIPMLLGDFLLTANGDRAGLRKKVHRLQPNLVVGWTGRLLAAEHVLTRLNDRFCAQYPTKMALEDFLESFPVEDLGALPVKLIGWIFDSEPHCFLWDSRSSRTLCYENYQLEGTGADLFQRLTGIGTAPEATGPPGPIQRSLTFLCYLMADEIGKRENQAAGFGHAYELLHLAEGEFRYVDDVVFLFAQVLFDSRGRFLGPRFNPIAYKYHHVSNDYALVQLSRMGSGNHEIERYLTSPAYKVADATSLAIAKEVFSLKYPVSFEAQYSCLYVELLGDADTAAPVVLFPVIIVTSPDQPVKAFTVKWQVPDPGSPNIGSLEVQLPPPEIFEMAYRDQVTVK